MVGPAMDGATAGGAPAGAPARGLAPAGGAPASAPARGAVASIVALVDQERMPRQARATWRHYRSP